ncbi:MAG: ABC-2 family transporter protein [Anaerolineae bacterium]|nr:ABC-2 family transporter protein [Thermoflexus sp.]MDW8064193.1 ABC-2 family transporter protein [Anaerolineae bacterium]
MKIAIPTPSQPFYPSEGLAALSATLRAYPTLLRIYWARTLEYRVQIVIWILSGAVPLVMLAVWLSLAQEGPIGSFDVGTFVGYYLAAIFLRRMTGVWIIWDLERDIRTGGLGARLLRPLHPLHYDLARTVASRPFQALLVGPPIALVLYLYPGPQLDLSLINLIRVMGATFMAMLLEFFFQYAIGLTAFWTSQAVAIHEVWFFIKSLGSGYVIPLALMPEGIQRLLEWTPFPLLLSFPLEMMLGRLPSEQIVRGFVGQGLWLLLAITLITFLWRLGIRRYEAFGA